jgi:uncharacterized lipoprotein YajG
MLSVRYSGFGALAFAMGAAAVLGLWSLLVGCSAQRLPISYVPQENVQPVKDADAVSVEVQVEDLQPNTFNHLSNILNPLGVDDSVTPFLVKDAAVTVEQAAESELKARGFRIAAGSSLIAIQVIHFEGDYISGSWQLTTTARANLQMQVQVRSQTGKVLYSREVDGEGDAASGVFVLPPAKRELKGALEDAFKRLFDDQGFTDAILATRQTPPAKPVSPGRIAGAFATMSRR